MNYISGFYHFWGIHGVSSAKLNNKAPHDGQRWTSKYDMKVKVVGKVRNFQRVENASSAVISHSCPGENYRLRSTWWWELAYIFEKWRTYTLFFLFLFFTVLPVHCCIPLFQKDNRRWPMSRCTQLYVSLVYVPDSFWIIFCGVNKLCAFPVIRLNLFLSLRLSYHLKAFTKHLSSKSDQFYFSTDKKNKHL